MYVFVRFGVMLLTMLTSLDVFYRRITKNMRDLFDAPVGFINADHKAGSEFTRTNVPLSGKDYGLQNGDAKPTAPNPDAVVRSFILAPE
jgi:hypothetical protein